MNKKFAVVLAAGQGTRMRSKLYKVLHPVCGKPMVQHIVDRLEELDMDKAVVVVGHGAEKVKDQLGSSVQYAFQEQQLGTGHAVLMSSDQLMEQEGTTLVLTGDTPLIKKETLISLMQHHRDRDAAATILSAIIAEPAGYGRIIRDRAGLVERIVEHKDATDEQKACKEINTGIFCFDNRLLFQALKKVGNNNVQGEYYLTDVIEILKDEGKIVAAYVTDDPDEGMGINDRVQLSKAEKIMRSRIVETHMRNGVTVIDPDTTYIDAEVSIGEDTVIYPGTYLLGTTSIGEDTVVGPNAHLTNVEVEDRVLIQHAVVADSIIRNEATVGPYAYIRPGSEIGRQARVGDFVEVKNTRLGDGSKVAHLSYLGDSEIGSNVNIGCGTITVNYDGVQKHRTLVGDNSFIGCNTNLIAPVEIGRDVYVAAGSTITKNVPDEAMAIARERQMNKEGYAGKFLRKDK